MDPPKQTSGKQAVVFLVLVFLCFLVVLLDLFFFNKYVYYFFLCVFSSSGFVQLLFVGFLNDWCFLTALLVWVFAFLVFSYFNTLSVVFGVGSNPKSFIPGGALDQGLLGINPLGALWVRQSPGHPKVPKSTIPQEVEMDV